MDSAQFRAAAHQLIEYTINYNDTIRERRPYPDVQPGYLRPLMPGEAPEEPETFEELMRDVTRLIEPGMTHWHSPQFHAYFPTASSYPALLGDMLCGTLTCIGFTWQSSPACTELEVIMLDWLGKLLGLPDTFLSCGSGTGGGVIQGTASEATLVAVLSSRQRAVNTLHCDISKLVAYTSDEAHCSVERAGIVAGTRMRTLPTDNNLSLRGETLRAAIEEDIKAGLVPFCVIATLGTTSTCAFDNLQELGEVCSAYPLVWLHVDAAYAGSSFVCEEFRGPLRGIELADSFNLNPHKWLLVNFDCSTMWFKKCSDVVDAFNVEARYLHRDHQMNRDAPDYRHWQLPLGRRFRSLKLWFVMRLYGRSGLMKHIRSQVALAHQFAELVESDRRFELVVPTTMGLVCFRLLDPDMLRENLKTENSKTNEKIQTTNVPNYVNGVRECIKSGEDINSEVKPEEKLASLNERTNALNERLVKAINTAGAIHLVPSSVRGMLFLRVAVCSRFTEPSDMIFAWREVQRHAAVVLGDCGKNGNYGANFDTVNAKDLSQAHEISVNGKVASNINRDHHSADNVKVAGNIKGEDKTTNDDISNTKVKMVSKK